MTTIHTAKKILAIVCEHTGVRMADLVGPSRVHQFTTARHIACLMLRRHTDCTLVRIGSLIGRRDHSTIISGLKTIQNRVDTDPNVSYLVDLVEKDIHRSGWATAPPGGFFRRRLFAARRAFRHYKEVANWEQI